VGEKKIDGLWDLDQLAGYLKMPKSTVRLHVAMGRIPSVKIGRHRRFIPSDVERAMKKLST